MTLDETCTALTCYCDLLKKGKPACFQCPAKPFCDDVTIATLKHKIKDKPKTNTEKQQELLIDTIKKYPAF